jgi:hypothetical protein
MQHARRVARQTKTDSPDARIEWKKIVAAPCEGDEPHFVIPGGQFPRQQRHDTLGSSGHEARDRQHNSHDCDLF